MATKSYGNQKILGCQFIADDGICTIVAKDFATETNYREMYVLGHEVKHCFDGKWHPE
jgi:hypothetical protein